MIDVRVRFTDPDGTWWTSAIRNAAALDLLTRTLNQRAQPFDVFDDEAHAAIADACFQAAEIKGCGGARAWMSWGVGEDSAQHRFCCAIALEPAGLCLVDEEDELVPTAGGFPLLDREPPGGWRAAQATPAPRHWLSRVASAVAWFFGDFTKEAAAHA